MSKMNNDDSIEYSNAEDAPGKPNKPQIDTGFSCSLSGCAICILISAVAWFVVYGIWQVVKDILTVAGVL